jgi:predicted ATPase
MANTRRAAKTASPPRLTRVVVKGFRSLQDVTFEPSPTNIDVLIGANGAGKSNLLQFLRMAALLRTGSLRTFVGDAGGASSLFHIGPRSSPSIDCDLEFDVGSGKSRYRASWARAPGERLVFHREQLGYSARGNDEWQVSELGTGHFESEVKDLASAARPNVIARHFNLCLKGISFFHFHDTSATSLLRADARIADGAYLRSNGSNLAAYLYALRESGDEDDLVTWRRIGLLVQQVAPFIKELQPTLVSPTGGFQARETPATSSVRLHWIDERDEVFGPHHLSDGTLRLIALVTALTQPAHRMPRFVSIDEPELGLHPAALSLVVELVRSISSRTQVLLATQSPALLSHFGPENVVVCERASNASHFRRLDRKDLEHWLADYSLAELFDKGVLGGRP